MRIKIINVEFKEDGVEAVENQGFSGNRTKGSIEVKIDSISVHDLLKKLDIPAFMVIVTRNGEVVREHELLTDKDNVQISGMGCC